MVEYEAPTAVLVHTMHLRAQTQQERIPRQVEGAECHDIKGSPSMPHFEDLPRTARSADGCAVFRLMEVEDMADQESHGSIK